MPACALLYNKCIISRKNKVNFVPSVNSWLCSVRHRSSFYIENSIFYLAPEIDSVIIATSGIHTNKAEPKNSLISWVIKDIEKVVGKFGSSVPINPRKKFP